jgi:pyridoxamine 5'-phosphate oxidase
MHDADPFVVFADAFARAAATAPAPTADHTAAALATADRDGRPSARMVLVRHVDPSGFVFFTNYESRKAKELAGNPRAALCFHWHWIEEQVRVEGSITQATPDESDAYFVLRPRGSQLAAWASDQSRVVSGRAVLEERYREMEARYANQDVPRPPFWGGYRLVPERIEFWRSGLSRLHDRLLYTREGTAWRAVVLNP